MSRQATCSPHVRISISVYHQIGGDSSQAFDPRRATLNVMTLTHKQTGRNVRKRTVVHVLPAKIQIRLRIRAVWSESSLCAFWIAKDAKFLHADNEDYKQFAQMRRLLWVFNRRTCKKVRILTLRLKYEKYDLICRTQTTIGGAHSHMRKHARRLAPVFSD